MIIMISHSLWAIIKSSRVLQYQIPMKNPLFIIHGHILKKEFSLRNLGAFSMPPRLRSISVSFVSLALINFIQLPVPSRLLLHILLSVGVITLAHLLILTLNVGSGCIPIPPFSRRLSEVGVACSIPHFDSEFLVEIIWFYSWEGFFGFSHSTRSLRSANVAVGIDVF